MSTALRLTLLGCVLVLAGCSTNPVTGERELSLVSEQQEIAIGSQQYAPSQQSQGGPYVVDPSLQDYINNIGQQLAAVSERPQLPYEFVVLNNSVPNAWALPGGKIAINRGLLLELQDEAELAAVVGHEIVHAAARHGASQMSRGQLTSLTAGLATVAAAAAGYGELGQAASQIGSAAFMARYGRDDELEADRYGMNYMAALGYDPQADVSLQETFVRLSQGQQQDFVSGLFASHPPSMDRVNANREHAKKLPSGNRYRQRYQQAIAQLKKDQPAYAKQQQAQTALKNKEPDKALALLDEAIAIQSAESSFWETRGHAWQMKKDLGKAQQAYSTAIRKNPDYFGPRLYRGLVRFELKKYAIAKEDLLTSHALLPNGVSAYYLGETSAALGNTEEATRYYQQAQQAGGDIGKQAEYKLVLMDLATNPDKYVASQAYTGNDGILRVAIKNNTGITLTNVRVSALRSADGYSIAERRNLRGSYTLKAGQRIDINTGIGPMTSNAQAQQWRSRVVAAEVANQQ